MIVGSTCINLNLVLIQPGPKLNVRDTIVNHPKIFYLIVWLFALPGMTLSHLDAIASDTARWGVTTKKKLEKNPSTAIDRTGLEADQDRQDRKDSASPDDTSKNQTDTEVNSTGKTMKSNQTKHPPLNRPTPQANELKATSPPSHKAKLKGQHTMPTAKGAKPSPKTMVWVDEQQKMTCQKYLSDLRKWFLKTRHYSIQGAPCQTKEFAAAFLNTKDNCIKDCPQGFLGQNGYTDRIVRNITYLEKLGKDRCEIDADAPSMPQIK